MVILLNREKDSQICASVCTFLTAHSSSSAKLFSEKDKSRIEDWNKTLKDYQHSSIHCGSLYLLNSKFCLFKPFVSFKVIWFLFCSTWRRDKERRLIERERKKERKKERKRERLLNNITRGNGQTKVWRIRVRDTSITDKQI